jgi:hypothetical protein
MYKKLIGTLALGIALLGSSINGAYAQDTFNNGNGTTLDQGGTTGTINDGTTAANTGPDWRWILPLVGIPLLFFLMRDNKDDRRSESRDRGLAGAKGGSSRRRDEEVI